MMKNKLIALFLFVAVAVNAAQIKDMSLDCGAKGCALTFKFASDKDLPSFYQKYDAKSHKLSLGFSATSFALGEGIFEIDAASNFVKSMLKRLDLTAADLPGIDLEPVLGAGR